LFAVVEFIDDNVSRQESPMTHLESVNRGKEMPTWTYTVMQPLIKKEKNRNQAGEWEIMQAHQEDGQKLLC